MSNDKGFRSMSVLVDGLRKAEEGLRGGALPLGALDAAVNDARELYERLVVLRHKAREAAQAKAAASAAAAAPASAPAPTAGAAASPPPTSAPKAAQAEPAAPAPIRLNTQPAAPRQTTLEEAIAEKEEAAPVMKTAAEYLKEAQATGAAAPVSSAARSAESIAEKLERARIPDLAKAISLSDKFWFTKELFGGDAKAYEVGVSLLNSAKDLGEAKAFLKDELLAKLKAPPDAEALEAFTELIERRFA